jgi:hypothetical protein
LEDILPRIRELVDELDRLVPKEGARLRIPSDPDGATTAGTQRGYLRLGVELLRAGVGPLQRDHAQDAPYVSVAVDYLLTADSDSPFELCEVIEDVDGLPPRVKELGAFGQLMAALVLVGVTGLIVVGAAAVLSWMLR